MYYIVQLNKRAISAMLPTNTTRSEMRDAVCHRIIIISVNISPLSVHSTNRNTTTTTSTIIIIIINGINVDGDGDSETYAKYTHSAVAACVCAQSAISQHHTRKYALKSAARVRPPRYTYSHTHTHKHGHARNACTRVQVHVVLTMVAICVRRTKTRCTRFEWLKRTTSTYGSIIKQLAKCNTKRKAVVRMCACV